MASLDSFRYDVPRGPRPDWIRSPFSADILGPYTALSEESLLYWPKTGSVGLLKLPEIQAHSGSELLIRLFVKRSSLQSTRFGAFLEIIDSTPKRFSQDNNHRVREMLLV